MTDHHSLETELIRLRAYVAALEAATIAVLDHLPNQDEELDAYQRAREKFLSLVTKRVR